MEKTYQKGIGKGDELELGLEIGN